MSPRSPGDPSRSGLCYALTDEGVELPVIDVTHPAFAVEVDPQEWKARAREHLRLMERRAKLPGFLQRLFLGFYRRRSVLLRGITDARGGFLSGMDTYLLKLGPGNLGRYAGRIDRRVAASFPAQAARIRLREAARHIAQGLVPALEARTSDLHLLNIAGGPAADSLNALILLRRDRPGLLERRSIRIHVLDLHRAAPSFGQRALSALQGQGPLRGLEVRLEHRPYDWAEPRALRDLLRALPGDAVVGGSSEGGLFQYGSDGEIQANLEVLREGTPADCVMTGSVSWEGPLARLSRRFSGLAVRAFEPAAFEALVRRAGWALDPGAGDATRQIVSLRKRPE